MVVSAHYKSLLLLLLLTTRFCLVLLIVNVSQINWLSCQISGISKRWENYASQM